jgi:hypothetical protein
MGAVVVTMVTMVTLIATLLAGVAAAGAQTSSLDGPGSAYAPPVEASPFSAGGLVFFFVAAVLLVGAGLLYLRHRTPNKTPSEPSS